MQGQLYAKAVDATVVFSDPKRWLSVRVTVDTVKVLRSEKVPVAIVLDLQMPYATWVEVETWKHFGVTQDSIDPEITSWELGSGAPVRMEIRLEGEARDALLGRFGDDDEALAAHVVDELTAERESPLLDSRSYKYLVVMQERSAGPTTFQSGFRSVWAKESHWH